MEKIRGSLRYSGKRGETFNFNADIKGLSLKLKFDETVIHLNIEDIIELMNQANSKKKKKQKA